MLTRSLLGLFLVALGAFAPDRVDPRNTYERLICVVPAATGQGTAADPKRPVYVPAFSSAAPAPQSNIIGFMQVPSDDGKYLIVEYIARNRSAFAQIQSDKQVKWFLKGKDSKKDIEAEIRRYRKNFDLDKFGVAMP